MKLFETKKRRWLWGTAVVAATAIALTFAGQVQAGPQQAPTYSAVELADAILFNDGPAAQHLAGLERPAIEWTPEATQSRAAIENAILSDPNWSASFASRVQSGDPVQVEAAVTDLGMRARDALDALWGKPVVDQALTDAGDLSKGRVRIWQTFVFIYRFFFFIRYIFVIWHRHLSNPVAARDTLPDELTVQTIATNLNAGGTG